MIRKILAVIGGLVAGAIVVSLVEMLSSSFYPLPDGVNMGDYAAMIEHAKNAPLISKIIVIVGWGLAAIAAGAIATLIARNGKNIYAVICAVIFLAFSVFNMFMIPSPVWFWILGTVVWIPLSLLGHKIMLKIKK